MEEIIPGILHFSAPTQIVCSLEILRKTIIVNFSFAIILGNLFAPVLVSVSWVSGFCLCCVATWF